MNAACLWNPLESCLLWTQCGARVVKEWCVQRSRCPTGGVQVSFHTPGHVWRGAGWASAHTEGDWGPDKGSVRRAATPESLASRREAGAYTEGAEPGLVGAWRETRGWDLEDQDGGASGAEPGLERRG